MRAAVIAVGVVGSTAFAVACGSAPRASSSTRAAPARASWDGELVDLLPANASVVVVAQPEQLAGAPAVRRVLESIATDDDLERYRQHTGIDVRRLEQLVWASTEAGSVLVVRGPFSAPLAVAEMGHRMLPVESSVDEPFVRRVGHYQGARRDLVALSDHVLLAVSGPPALAEEVLRRAARALTGSVLAGSVLAEEPIASMRAAHAGAPLVVVAPRPLGLPIDTPVGLLLARQHGLVASAIPSGPETIALAAELGGEFPPGAEANFRALVESLAASDLGEVLGIAGALPTLTVHADAEHVTLRATLAAPALAAGLHVLFGAEIAEIVGSSDTASASRSGAEGPGGGATDGP